VSSSEVFEPVDSSLWGKRRGLAGPYPLICHLLDAAAVMGVLWDLYTAPATRRFIAAGLGVDEEHARCLLMFWAGLHDVGKVTCSFQVQAEDGFAQLSGYEEVPADRIKHAFAVHAWLGRVLEEHGYDARKTAFRTAQLLGGHHGRFSSLGPEMKDPLAAMPSLGRGKWESQRRAMFGAVFEIAGAPAPPRALKAAAAGIICGLVILADWLVSQDEFILSRLKSLPAKGNLESLRAHFLASSRAAPDLLAKAGLSRLRLQAGSFEQEFPRYPPNYLQESVAENLPALLSDGPGLLLITVPMGDGKTEAALHGGRLMGEAAGTPGLYLGLPTMATADQMYTRIMDYGIRRSVDPSPLTLLHSTAWLNPSYSGTRLGEETETEILTGEDLGGSWMAATEWLQAAKRGLLAPLGVGTIDQALLAALCGKHNMLRLLGLSGKVLIVDEVHAYDAFMQGLLCRLLTWLGWMKVPVVLLSATLPKHVGRRLVEAYLSGAGHRVDDLAEVGYPGWLYADAVTGVISPFEVKTRSRRLDLQLVDVPLGKDNGADRSAALKRLLAPTIETGEGYVGVVCNTVAESQQTFRDLKAWFKEIADAGGPAPELGLLHSRFPAAQRAQITTSVVARYGKGSRNDQQRPRAAVLVATQVIEQSLDLDFDLLISDLAPIALLFQRAGRCWRHAENPRPAWARHAGLAVLMPIDGSGAASVPVSWPFVYPMALLRRTRELLAGLGEVSIKIPEDIQPMVEKVYSEDFTDPDSPMGEDDIARIADDQVRLLIAMGVSIPEPLDIRSLHQLTESDLDESLITTRLGADSARVLCCYRDLAGKLWLDPQLSRPVPFEGTGPKKRFTRAEVRELLAEIVPIPGAWAIGRTAANEPPVAWGKNAHLRDVLLLPHSVDQKGNIQSAEIGTNSFVLRVEEGLVRLTS
jgi:CRISPR-associated endonuclease/helicase Cas3